MTYQLKRRESGPPVDCVNARTCGATGIYGFEVQHKLSNCHYAACVDCARTMSEGEGMSNPHEFAAALSGATQEQS